MVLDEPHDVLARDAHEICSSTIGFVVVEVQIGTGAFDHSAVNKKGVAERARDGHHEQSQASQPIRQVFPLYQVHRGRHREGYA
eukprot:CAMPEP_0206583576 /NCGR_PEP_ID=MMETSP0325_2-20121206/35187_1 /ASSEMBLY_ACC=CAM_ASM_000347 /TAXON_ID=2866 /ORGANISM="Crypthecodinium cohnii, Strain Seligo" /LENGTH=83 /DNA_ID=CAMNT_0054090525 /DNA_START=536 /DNA_END=787 /DNA_ORIENTATION=-